MRNWIVALILVQVSLMLGGCGANAAGTEKTETTPSMQTEEASQEGSASNAADDK